MKNRADTRHSDVDTPPAYRLLDVVTEIIDTAAAVGEATGPGRRPAATAYSEFFSFSKNPSSTSTSSPPASANCSSASFCSALRLSGVTTCTWT